MRDNRSAGVYAFRVCWDIRQSASNPTPIKDAIDSFGRLSEAERTMYHKMTESEARLRVYRGEVAPKNKYEMAVARNRRRRRLDGFEREYKRWHPDFKDAD